MTLRLRRHIPIAALLLLCAALYGSAAWAAPAQPAHPAPGATGIDAILGSARTSGDDFLPPDKAFRFDAFADGTDRVQLSWAIADGYYLYRARIKVKTPSSSAQLGVPEFPAGQVKTDEYFGKQEVYHHELTVTVPVARASGGSLDLPLEVTYQGCADAGLCYPPQTKVLSVRLGGGGGQGRGAGEGGEAGHRQHRLGLALGALVVAAAAEDLGVEGPGGDPQRRARAASCSR